MSTPAPAQARIPKDPKDTLAMFQNLLAEAFSTSKIILGLASGAIGLLLTLMREESFRPVLTWFAVALLFFVLSVGAWLWMVLLLMKLRTIAASLWLYSDPTRMWGKKNSSDSLRDTGVFAAQVFICQSVLFGAGIALSACPVLVMVLRGRWPK